MCLTLAAGTVDSIGGGGGLISVPAFLAAGVPPFFLLGTNKSMATAGACVAAFRYGRSGLLPRLTGPAWTLLIGLAIVGGGVGALVSQLPLVVDNLRFLVPVLLSAVMFFLAYRWFIEKKATDSGRVLPGALDPAPVLRGHLSRGMIALIGLYDGLFGPGTGTFYLSYFEKRGIETLTGNAITKVFNLSSNIGALLVFAFRERIDWHTGMIAAGSYMVGNWLGSGLALQRGQRLIRVTVLIVTGLMLVRTAWSLGH